MGAFLMKWDANKRGTVWPVIFSLTVSWVIWYFPKFIAFAGLGNDAINSQYSHANALDFAFLIAAAVSLVMGIRGAAPTHGEGVIETPFDRIALFCGRVVMVLIVVLVSVMFYEVVARYVFEAPTLWANELSLWVAGFIFLLSGLYAQQQRTHIRIYLIYDMFPRNVQRACDTVSAALVVIFAFALVWGGWGEAAAKFLRWETFGTAFDPPIPATLKPMVLLIIVILAIQGVLNLIADWNKGPQIHDVVDTGEIDDMIQTFGGKSAPHGQAGSKGTS